MNWVVTRHRNERAKPNTNWKKHLCSRLQPNFPTCQSGKLDLKNKKLVWTSGLKKGQSITVWGATLYSGIVLTVWSSEKETTTTTKKYKHKIANFWKQCRSWWLVTHSLQNLQVRGVARGVLGCPWPPLGRPSFEQTTYNIQVAKTPWQYLDRKSYCWKAHFFEICFFVKYFRQRLLSLVNMGLYAAIIRLSPLIHEGEQRYKPHIVGDPWMVSLSVTPPLKNLGYVTASYDLYR